MKKTAINPLRRYLKKEKITQRQFAAMLSELRGGIVYEHLVSKWCNGLTRPNAGTVFFIDVATGGKVTARSWVR